MISVHTGLGYIPAAENHKNNWYIKTDHTYSTGIKMK